MGLDSQQVNEHAMKVAKKLGVEDAVFLSVVAREQMVRFANDSLSVSKRIDERVLSVYLAKGGKRIVGGSTNVEKQGIESFVERLHKTMVNLTRDPTYVPLPKEARKFTKLSPHDEGLGESEKDVSEAAPGGHRVRQVGGREEERRGDRGDPGRQRTYSPPAARSGTT